MDLDTLTKSTARLALQSLMLVPANVRLAAVILILRGCIVADVKPTEWFSFLKRMNDQMVKDLELENENRGAGNAKKAGNDGGSKNRKPRKGKAKKVKRKST